MVARGEMRTAAGAMADLPRLDAAAAAREVPEDLLRRHLGLPPGAALESGLRALIALARERYIGCGSAWAGISLREIAEVRGDEVRLVSGPLLASPVLAEGIRASGGHALAVAAVTAGRAVDEEIDRLWRSDLPDESLFLHAYAVAAVEHLRSSAARLLAGHLERSGEFVLPHSSPGYEGWDLSGQASLLALISGPVPIRVLPSGGLAPLRSAVAAHGITRAAPPESPILWPRAAGETAGPAAASRERPFPERALARWSSERLRITPRGDGRVEATFRFDGTTCSSLGMPVAFDYRVTLTRGAGRFAVEACSSAPAEGDEGHRAMCSYRSDPARLLADLGKPPPFLGLGLAEAAATCRDAPSSGCLCLPGFRTHKWKMVLETIRYALDAGLAGGGGGKEREP